MKIALLVDGQSVTRWQAESIWRLGENIKLTVYNCTNQHPPRRRLGHYPYYLLNLLSLRSARTSRVNLSDTLRVTELIDFECRIEGNWQSLPDDVVDRINSDYHDAVVKFGLGLLKVPERLTAPILSYHHGDPRKFRGRPAGFYELLSGERVLGQVVQILSDRLDAGRVVAFAETPIHRHSYRATMRQAYAVSPLLLGEALKSVAGGRTLDIVPGGKLFRLPSSPTVLRFAAQRLAAKLRRLAYGVFVEKAWQVAQARLAFHGPRFPREFPPSTNWQIAKRPNGFRFLADPFPNPSGPGMLVEALRSSTGLGEILLFAEGKCRTLLRGKGHYSYPATLKTEAGDFLLPEVCQWSTPTLFRLQPDGAQALGAVTLDRPARLVDPTLFARHGMFFLFANDYSEGDFILRLWCADAIDGVFHEHPASPLLISPRGGRMGGMLVERDGLYRIGQDGSGDYGDGVFLFRIDELTRESYRESMVDRLRFDHVHGPHTVNFADGTVLFDFYTHRFAMLAGLRRLRNRIASGRVAQIHSAR